MRILIVCFFQSTDFNKTRYKVFKLDFTFHFQGNQTENYLMMLILVFTLDQLKQSPSFGAQGYVFLPGEPNGSEDERVWAPLFCSTHGHPVCRKRSSNPCKANYSSLAPSPERNLVPDSEIRLRLLGLKFFLYPPASKM